MASRNLDMKQAEVRVYNLWNGSTNVPINAVQPGWTDTAFDDSGWTLSANPSVNSVFLLPSGTPSSLPAGGPEAIWPTGSMSNVAQAAAFRWHVSFPGSYTFTSGTFSNPNNRWYAADVFPLIALWVNGVGPVDAFGINNSNLHSRFVAGDNVVAGYVAEAHYNVNADVGQNSQPLWDATTAWFTWRLVLDAQAGGSRGQVIG